MKNTKKYIKIKNKYTRKNKRKNAKMYFLKGGDSENEHDKTKESSYCDSHSRTGPCDPSTCCSKNCSPELCKPYQDLVTNGVYVPVKPSSLMVIYDYILSDDDKIKYLDYITTKKHSFVTIHQ